MSEQHSYNINSLVRIVKQSNPNMKWRQISQVMKIKYGINISGNRCLNRWKTIEKKQKKAQNDQLFNPDEVDQLMTLLQSNGPNFQLIQSKFSNIKIDIIKEYLRQLFINSIMSLNKIFYSKEVKASQIKCSEAKRIEFFLMGSNNIHQQLAEKLRNRLIDFIRFRYGKNKANLQHQQLKKAYQLLLVIKEQAKNKTIPTINKFYKKQIKNIQQQQKIKQQQKNIIFSDNNQLKNVVLKNKVQIQAKSFNNNYYEALKGNLKQQPRYKYYQQMNIHFGQLYCKHQGNFKIMLQQLIDKTLNSQIKIVEKLYQLVYHGLNNLVVICKERYISFDTIIVKIPLEIVKCIVQLSSILIYQLRVKLINLNFHKIITNNQLKEIVSTIDIIIFNQIYYFKKQQLKNNPQELKQLLKSSLIKVVRNAIKNSELQNTI